MAKHSSGPTLAKTMPAIQVLQAVFPPVHQRMLWQVPESNAGIHDDKWADDRSSTSWLTELSDNIYRDENTQAIYRYRPATDQFQILDTTHYFDPELDRIFDKASATTYILDGKFYSYDGRYYREQAQRLHSFNVPQNEELRSDQVDLQPPVRIDTYLLLHPQVISTLTAPDGSELRTGGDHLDRRGIPHTQPGVYTITFEIYYAQGRSTKAIYQYRVRNATTIEELTSEYEVPIYLGSHWTTSRHDEAFSSGNLRDDVNIDAQLGEGLYMTEDRNLGLKAAFSKLMLDKVKPPPAAIVEWRIYKIPGVDLRDLPTRDMPHALNWRAMPWRRDVQGGNVLRNYDTITKPAIETESKLNPRAFRKVRIERGERLIVKDNLRLFERIQDQMGKDIMKGASSGGKGESSSSKGASS